MDNDINPYQSPAAKESVQSDAATLDAGPQVMVGPIALALIGVMLTIGTYGFSIMMIAMQVPEPLGPMSFFASLLLTPPLRLVWVIFTSRQRRLYQHTWTPGAKTFVFTVWIINVILLCMDAMLIFLFGTCLVVITSQ